MPSLNDIVNVTITKNTRLPSRKGFGTPLIMAYHTVFEDTWRLYTNLDEMVSDGFAISSAPYRMAQAVFSANPRPGQVIVGRLSTAHSQTVDVTITSATEGKYIRFKVITPDGTETSIEYQIPASATTSTVATAVATLVNALSGVDATATDAVITVDVTTDGGVFYITELENCTQEDKTADAGYDDELTALRLVNDDWYFPLLDINSSANVSAVSAWAESREKMFAFSTADDVEANGTGTLFSGLKSASRERTFGIWNQNPSTYAAAAWVGACAPFDAGSLTWAFKALSGVSPSNHLTPTQKTNLENVNANVYVTIGGLPMTWEGKTSEGEYVDIIHGTDALIARIQEAFIAVLANNKKMGYTNASKDSLVGTLFGVLESFATSTVPFLDPDSLEASGPDVGDVDTADRGARLLPDLAFSGRYQGAIHKVKVNGALAI